jgi:glycosyltransferase A (GT-A) superfamily protein (DUF2064 family)
MFAGLTNALQRAAGRLEQQGSALTQLAPRTTGLASGLVSRAAQALAAGSTLVGLALSGGLAILGLSIAAAAVLALHFLLTRVLGLELEFDPAAFYARYAPHVRAAWEAAG